MLDMRIPAKAAFRFTAGAMLFQRQLGLGRGRSKKHSPHPRRLSRKRESAQECILRGAVVPSQGFGRSGERAARPPAPPCRLIEEILSRAGVDVVAVENGVEACRALRKRTTKGRSSP